MPRPEDHEAGRAHPGGVAASDRSRRAPPYDAQTAVEAARPVNRSHLAASQAKVNGILGPRVLPAKMVPVPAGLNPVETALVAGPYSPFWNLAPGDAAAWATIQQGRAESMAPMLAAMRAKLGVSMTEMSLGGVRAYLLTPAVLAIPRREQLVFYLHGGGYVLGQGETGTMEAVLMAAYGGYRVLSLDYRLAPEAPYPAALDDAAAAWRAATTDVHPRRVAIAGISAGGGLALSLMLRIRAAGLPSPAALALGSPWSDMTRTGDSYETNEWLDNVLVSYDGYLARAGRLYADGRDLREPELSPIYGDFHGFPPATLFSGTRDLFLSNTVRTHRKLREAGIPAELHVFEGLAHAQYALDPDAPATKQTYGEMADFFDRHLG